MTSPHRHHIISIQYPSHKCLPEKPWLHCLRILIMSWLFKDPVVIMKKIISWLIQDPINSGLAQFQPCRNQTVKYGLMAKKIKLSQMNFFLERQLIKFSCTYLPLSFCKIFKKFLELIQNYEDVSFSGPKWHICTEQFFWCKPLLSLSSTYWPISLCKILKNSYSRSRVMTMCYFWAQNGPFAPNKDFMENY